KNRSSTFSRSERFVRRREPGSPVAYNRVDGRRAVDIAVGSWHRTKVRNRGGWGREWRFDRGSRASCPLFPVHLLSNDPGDDVVLRNHQWPWYCNFLRANGHEACRYEERIRDGR